MNFKTLAAAVTLAAVAAPALAVDGTFSTTQSQGSTVITANIGNLVRISNIDDPITLLPNAGGDLTYTDNICLFRNGVDNQNLNMTFASATGVGSFLVTDGVNNVGYVVALVAGTFNGAVTENTVTTANASSDNTPTCGGADNASYSLTIPQASVVAAVAGNYTDTLTITIAPL